MVSWFTAFIALIVAGIAFLQWATARQKVLLDLFDKRFAVYEELRDVVGGYFSSGRCSPEEISKFTRVAGRAQFLFGSEVTSYLEERRLDLARVVYAQTHPPGSVPQQQRQAAEDDMVARVNRLADFYKDLDVLVVPYMSQTQKIVRIPLIDS
jgi:hypothetical protein